MKKSKKRVDNVLENDYIIDIFDKKRKLPNESKKEK